MGKSRAAVVLERPEHGLGVGLVAGSGEEAAAAVIDEIVAIRGDGARDIRNAGAECADLEGSIPNLQCRAGVIGDGAAFERVVTAESAVADGQGIAVAHRATGSGRVIVA
ncbi:MAG: hypothetical protein DMF06_10325 [Verrucomicrobia bacterium]|nr:MAG: hypothetical protein DMF06_10325 [Verrucomicrobiota bacterium]